jgi:hypothetical protein
MSDPFALRVLLRVEREVLCRNSRTGTAGFDGVIEEQRGRAILALMPFTTAETEPHIISTAALSLCVLCPAEGGALASPRFLTSVLIQNPPPDAIAGAAFGGIMLLGDERLSSLIRQVWEQWPPEARLTHPR